MTPLFDFTGLDFAILQSMMKKISTLSLLLSLLFLMANCGSSDSQGLSYLQPAQSVNTSSITSIHYQYSLEVDRNAIWQRSEGFSQATSCADEWYLKIMSLLESAEIESGRLTSGSYHTANNPFHRLTVTYSDGRSQAFNLHIATSYNNELILSNTDEIIDYYSAYFANPNSCPE